MIELPERIELDDGAYLRFFVVDDAEAVARAVSESLEHLRPWMPWADEQSTDPAFQRDRLRKLPAARRARRGVAVRLVPRDGSGVLGSFGLMTRRGPGTIEIGYWVHVDAGGRGLPTRAGAALTDVALGLDGIRRVLICCDEENVRSAAIPRRLGYRLLRTETRAPEAPGERGRLMLWARDRDVTDG